MLFISSLITALIIFAYYKTNHDTKTSLLYALAGFGAMYLGLMFISHLGIIIRMIFNVAILMLLLCAIVYVVRKLLNKSKD